MNLPGIVPGGILCVVGARPNFMKIAPVMVALRGAPHGIDAALVHTGQHYDLAMNQQYFAELGIPAPNVNLEVGSASHAMQTAEIMRRFEPVLDETRPAAVLVVGDVNSTIACALVAVKKEVPVIHVEAGLRSFDRSMPEEINRVLTDQVSDLLFTTELSGRDNLLREGIEASRIHFVGNVMIDTLRNNLRRAVPAAETLNGAAPSFPVGRAGYAVLTMHRPSNVDEPDVLQRLLKTVRQISETVPVIFPLHPRTSARIEQFGFHRMLNVSTVLCLPPLGYLAMLGLIQKAKVVLTDSGGIQEETTALGIPCITLRDNTERPITVEAGTNTIAGRDPARILKAFQEIVRGRGKANRIPELWDGKASLRIAAVIRDWLEKKRRLRRSAA
jgi:UDP-N-acetylglucosamine 2-epimerase (non-hydrolysing)